MATTRERLRAETVEEIKAAARARLDSDGANLSLRAVARDVGLVSSAVYRYFPSRDALLTALIIDAFNGMGAVVEQAEATVARDDLHGRFLAFGRSLRGWALAQPSQYALIFGSPVPGYAAPQDTVAPAARVTTVLAGILSDGVRTGALTEPDDRVAPALRPFLREVLSQPPFADVPPALLARGMAAWSSVYGLVSFELFGSYGPIDDPEALFEHQLHGLARGLGLAPLPRRRARATRDAT